MKGKTGNCRTSIQSDGSCQMINMWYSGTVFCPLEFPLHYSLHCLCRTVWWVGSRILIEFWPIWLDWVKSIEPSTCSCVTWGDPSFPSQCLSTTDLILSLLTSYFPTDKSPDADSSDISYMLRPSCRKFNGDLLQLGVALDFRDAFCLERKLHGRSATTFELLWYKNGRPWKYL